MTVDGFFGYEAVQKAVDALSLQAAPQITSFMNVVKGLAIGFVLLNWIRDAIESTKSIGSGKVNYFPVAPSQIIFGIFYIAIISNSTVILTALDTLMAEYVGDFKLQGSGTSISVIFNRWCAEYEQLDELVRQQEESNIPVLGGIYNGIQHILDVITGAFYFVILVIVKGIAWIVNTIAYPVFLIERGFLLFAMKITAPLVFALAALKEYRELFYKWIKVYCAIFITGLFFIVVTWFCDQLFISLADNFNSNAMNGIHQGDIFGLDLGYKDRHLVQVCFYTMIGIAKVKLYQSSISLSNRIFA
ncbi:MAG: hypothetical protein ACK5MK_06880 [Dysgonomonas sp.]